MVVIGSARSAYNSPAAGDQSGKECSTQNFYKKNPYWLGFTLKKAELLPKLAQAMKDACANNHFGYSQYYRLNGRQAYVKYGSIKAVAVDCTVDCSSLVNLCLYSIGINLPNFNTASQPKVFRESGLFTEKKVYSEADCVLGMILVTPTQGHTVIVVECENEQTGIKIPTEKPILRNGSKGVRVKELQTVLNNSMNSGLAVDGIFGPLTEAALKNFQSTFSEKFYKIEIDGEYGPETRQAFVKFYSK